MLSGLGTLTQLKSGFSLSHCSICSKLVVASWGHRLRWLRFSPGRAGTTLTPRLVMYSARCLNEMSVATSPTLSDSAAITGVASKIVQNDSSVVDSGVVVVLCVRSCRSVAEATTIEDVSFIPLPRNFPFIPVSHPYSVGKGGETGNDQPPPFNPSGQTRKRSLCNTRSIENPVADIFLFTDFRLSRGSGNGPRLNFHSPRSNLLGGS